MQQLTIGLLGPFDVALNGVPVTGFAYTKVRALLAYLAVESDRPQTRAHLAALLWPDVPERLARQNLSQALTVLRDILGDREMSDIGSDAPFLLVTTDTIQLNPAIAYRIDVRCFGALLAQVEAHPHRDVHMCAFCIQQLAQAVALYRGAFLEQLPTLDSDLFEEWAQLLREHLCQQAMGALERLTRAAEWHERYDEAITYAHQQISLAPDFEASHRHLMQVLALAGRPHAALEQYEQLYALLVQEQDAVPEPETTLLRDQIAVLMPSAHVASRCAPAPSGDLAATHMSFGGRSGEAEAVCAGLRAAVGRMLTIVGEAGTGKTALALDVAHVLRYEFADGVYLVDLTKLTDPTDVLRAIAAVVAMPIPVGPASGGTLAAYLRTRHMLLILDGFEHVLDTAPAIAALLAACPELRVLVTSRVPLRVRAESRFYLAALPYTERVPLRLRQHA